MDQSDICDTWRHKLGRVGVWLGAYTIADDPAKVAKDIEALGYGAIFIGGGAQDDEAFARLEEMLRATKRLVIATGIANIWAWDAAALYERASHLVEMSDDRFLLGLGVSHAPTVERIGRNYEHPLRAMDEFLDSFDEARTHRAERHNTYPEVPRVLAALAPRMIGLSAKKALGAHPYLATPAHTASARALLGESPLLIPEQTVVVDDDATSAREKARPFLTRYLRLPNYDNNLARLGYSDVDRTIPGSDRLVDEVIIHGTAAEVASGIQAHLDAGADHVCIQPLALEGNDLSALEKLAPLLNN